MAGKCQNNRVESFLRGGDTLVNVPQFYGLSVGTAAIAIPEPSTLGLLGVCGLVLVRRRMR